MVGTSNLGSWNGLNLKIKFVSLFGSDIGDPCRWSEWLGHCRIGSIYQNNWFSSGRNMFSCSLENQSLTFYESCSDLYFHGQWKKTSWLAKDHFSILFNSCSPLFPGNKENFMALTPWPLSVTTVPRSSIMCHDTRGQIWMDAGVPRRWSRCVLYCQQFSLWSIWVNYNHLTVLPHWKS